jgi:phosphoglycolate phosphatase
MSAASRTRLIAFDLDGTLVDSSRDLCTALNRALPRLVPGAPPLDLEVVRGFIGEGALLLLRRSLDHVGRPEIAAEEALPVFLEAYRGCLLDTTLPYPGVEGALDGLASGPEAPALAVLTNKPGDLSRALVDGLGWSGRFAHVLGSGDGLPRKPDPAGLRWLMTECGAVAGETALVGDSRIDVLTGRAAGVLTVGVDWGLDPRGLRAAGPDVVVSDARALGQALRGTVLG